MSNRYAPARFPSGQGAHAESASGCLSAGGQRTIELSHRALPQSPARASEACMVQRPLQRLKGLQRLLLRSLASAFTCNSHRRPNPSVKRTVNGGARSAVFAEAVPPLSAAYLIR